MKAFVCVTCGVQQRPSAAPERCPICEDERQYVPPGGQGWVTIDELRERGHRIIIRELEPQLLGIGVEPRVGIGQRALLVRTGSGNFMWDCLGYIDQSAIDQIRSWGGLAGIAISHPHFFGACVEWSKAFGGTQIYIPASDREWVQYPDRAVTLWEGTYRLSNGVSLIQCGGHFEGSAVLHVSQAAEGRGALLVGDTIGVAPDLRYVSFMRSYPNFIPLPADAVRRIRKAVEPYPFDRIYGGWWDRVVRLDARAALDRSVERYLRWIGENRIHP